MDEDCSHNRGTYHLDCSDRLRYECPDCYLSGETGSAEEARVAFLPARLVAGESLDPTEGATVAYSRLGAAPSRHHG